MPAPAPQPARPAPPSVPPATPPPPARDLDRDPRMFAIIGAAMEAHRELGGGYPAALYQEALGIELGLRNIPNRRAVDLPLQYRGRTLALRERIDFVCHDGILVRVTCAADLVPGDEDALRRWMRLSGFELGVLVNFGVRALEHRRVARAPVVRPAAPRHAALPARPPCKAS